MVLIDTHCHLYAKEFEADITDVIQRGIDAGVDQFYLPAIDSSTHQAMLALELRFPGICVAMAGLHPCSVKENYKDELARVEAMLAERKFAALGETGLDFYWDRNFDEQQYQAFRQQIDWAVQYKLAIVIHSRESVQECIEEIKKQKGNISGIFHCFSGTREQAREIVECGLYLGIGGVITYKKSNLPEILENISLQHMVLETDAPYLSPVPYRGKRNESSYLVQVAQKLAEIKGVPVEEVAAITTANAQKIFGN